MVSVHRTLRDYLIRDTQNPFRDTGQTEERGRIERKSPMRKTEGGVPAERQVSLSLGGRRERILSIIKDKGEATIKDVSSVITDCSEKTIQRELMSLISEGVLVKEGERRWSIYKLA
jgi:predicted HTH transcriptional regulator